MSKNSVIIGTRGKDVLTGTPGDDLIFGGRGSDRLDGRGGDDWVFGGRGNDVLVYRPSENAGAHDRYFGGPGRDTLRLELTRAEWLRPDVQADIARFLRDSRHFEFTAFDLDLRGIENLEVRVDGKLLNPRDERVDAKGDKARVSEDGTVTGNVVANDSVPDLVRSVELVSGPAHGTLVLATDGSFSYTPGEFFNSLDTGETATESFVYRVTDADGDSDTAKVVITITGANDAPVTQNDSNTASNDGVPVTGNVLANDRDPDIEPLKVVNPGTYTLQHGTLTIRADGSYSYLVTDTSGAAGEDVFVYKASDGTASTAGTLTITIAGGANHPPVTQNDANAATDDGVAVGGNVLANDSDPDLDPLFVANPGTYDLGHGRLTIAADGSYSYAVMDETLDTGDLAQDAFVYRASDGAATTNGTLTIQLSGSNDAPVTQNDANSATDNGVAVSGNVLTNDTDADLEALGVANPGTYILAHGRLTIDANGGYSYVVTDESLAAGQVAQDEFTYVASDGTEARDGTLTLDLTGSNDAPDAAADSVGVMQALRVAVVYQDLWPSIDATVAQLNDDTWFDFAAAAVHFSDADSAAELAQFDAVLLGNSDVETFSAEFWAALRGFAESGEGVVANGWTNFSLARVREQHGAQANADYDASVPITGDDLYSAASAPFVPVDGGHPITRGISGIQAGPVVTASLNLDPGAASLATLSGDDHVIAYLELPGGGREVYLGFHYTDNVFADFLMRSGDGDRLLEQAAAWSAGQNGGGMLSEDAVSTIAAADLLANDTDVDALDSLSVVSVAGSSASGAAVSLAGGNVLYDPTQVEAIQALDSGETLDDTFTYTIADSQGATDSATVTVRVSGRNDAPVTQDDSNSAADDGLAVSGNVLANDSDPDVEPLFVANAGEHALDRGTLTIEADGSYSYVVTDESLAAGELDQEVFTYQASDGSATSEGTLTIHLTGLNDAPVAGDNTISGDLGGVATRRVALVYQELSDSIGATIDQLNDDTWFDFQATAVHFSDAESAAALAQFDVVLLGNADVETFSAGFWAALRAYVESGEGGVVANGFTNYSLGRVHDDFGSEANADYDASVPVTGDDRYNSDSAPFVAVDDSHPITTGITGIQAGSFVAASLGIDAGAGSLAALFGDDHVVAYHELAGGGHQVYLGFNYTDPSYADSLLRTGDGDRLLEQALAWSGEGSGAAIDEDHVLVIEGETLLANDVDPDAGDTLTIISVSGTSTLGAEVSLDMATGEITYDPTAALQHLGAGESATDTFSYTISDSHGATDSATVTLTIAGVNDAPQAEADKVVIVPAGSGEVGLNIAAPTDVDGDELTVTIEASPDNGALAKADGTPVGSGGTLTVAELTGLTFTPTGAAGSESSLTYRVSDGQGGSDAAVVSFSLVDAGGAGAVRVAVVYGDPLPIAGTDPLASIDGATRTAAQLNDDTHYDFEATILHVSDADSAAELGGYDVVYSAGSAHDPMTPAYWAALQDYSETNQGGVITDGWFAFTLSTYLPANADANYVSPIASTGFNLISSGGTLTVTGGHPITEGITSIAVGGGPDAFWELADALDPGATSLAPTGSDHGIAYRDAAGEGRTVYLGGIYSESETTYDTTYLRSGAADQLLEQAVNWAARSGPTPLSLFGGSGNDVLVGGDADDTLTGNGGNDSLTGGAGSDRFDYDAITDGTDTVTDFTPGAGGDALDIRDILVGYSHAERNDFIQLEGAGGSTTVRVNADGDGTDLIALATLQGQTGLTLDSLLADGNLIVS